MKVHVGGKSEYPSHLRMLIAGEPFSKKLELACQAPNPLVLTVGNADSVALSRLGCRYIEIETEADLMRIKELLQEPDYEDKLSGPVDTLILSTVDELQRLLFVNKLREERRVVTSAADWGWMGVRLNAIFGGLKTLDKNIVYLTSLKQDDLGMFRIGVQGAFNDQIHNYVDISALLSTAPIIPLDETSEDDIVGDLPELGEQNLFMHPLEPATWVGNDLTDHSVLTVDDTLIQTLLNAMEEEREFLAPSEVIDLDEEAEVESKEIEIPGMSSDEDLEKILN